MREVKGSECAVLTLVMKRKWYDMIASGEKCEEYRTSVKVWREIERWCGRSMIWHIPRVIVFALGYQPDRQVMAFDVHEVELRLRSYHPEWGEPAAPHYVIRLGERVLLK